MKTQKENSKLFIVIIACFLFVFLAISCSEQTETNNAQNKFHQLPDSVLFKIDSTGNTLLHKAVIESDTSFTNYLLNKGIDIDHKNNKGYTALHLATENGDTLNMKILLKNHADVHAVNDIKNTPLHLAVFKNNIKAVEMLFYNGAYSDALKENIENFSPVTYAVRKRYYSVAELLYWPLHYLIKRDKKEYFKYVINIKEKSIGQKDMKGMTPLHIAYLYENSYFIEKLVTAGSDQNAKDNFNRKPDDYRYDNFFDMVDKDILSNALRKKIDDKIFDFLIHYNWMTVGIIKEGEIAYLRSFGMRNMVNEDAVYASVSKPVTSIIFMQLINEGIINNLDDNISKYSNKYNNVIPNNYGADSITFKHILTHRSGLPHINKPLWNNGKLNLQFKPGSNFLYTTNGFGVLGEILEEITGKTYSELVKKYIGEPVQSGSFWAEKNFRAPGARVHSSTKDFANFAWGVINNKYISEENLSKVVLVDYEGVGLGWGCENFNTKDITMMHAGSNGRPRAYILLKPKKKIGIVLMGDCETKDDIWFVHLGPILMDILENKGSY